MIIKIFITLVIWVFTIILSYLLGRWDEHRETEENE